MNNVTLIGRLTRDPELRYTPTDGKPLVRLGVAVNRPGSDQADFIDVVAFGRLAEAVAAHIAKGRRIGVTGALRQQRWTDTETDQRRSRIEVLARAIDFLDAPRTDQTAAGAPAPAHDGDPSYAGEDPGEEPF
jgi:single-strand DNA-binding protein